MSDKPPPNNIPQDPFVSYGPTTTMRRLKHSEATAVTLVRAFCADSERSAGSARPEPQDTGRLADEVPFDFVELIAEGGFGEVWSARQRDLNRMVAVNFGMEIVDLKGGRNTNENSGNFSKEDQVYLLGKESQVPSE